MLYSRDMGGGTPGSPVTGAHHNQQLRGGVRSSPSPQLQSRRPLSREVILGGIDKGTLTVQDVDRMRRQRETRDITAKVATPSGTLRRSDTAPNTAGASGSPSSRSPLAQQTTPSTAGAGVGSSSLSLSAIEASPSLMQHLTVEVSQAAEAHGDEMTLTALDVHATYDTLCAVHDAAQRHSVRKGGTSLAVPPRWLVAKRNAEAARQQRAERETVRHAIVGRMPQVGVDEAVEVARIVAKQEEVIRRMEDRSGLANQLQRFVDLELRVRDGAVPREERRELVNPTAPSVDTLTDRVVELHRAREKVDRPFRTAEPQHMRRMASDCILQEQALQSFGDELALLASKSDTNKLMQQRNQSSRKQLLGQLAAWTQSVIARGDLSDVVEEFIATAPKTADGSILLSAIYAMMEQRGIRLSSIEREQFESVVDPLQRGCVLPERLRHAWRTHEFLRNVRPMDRDEAMVLFDETMQDHQAPISATFLVKWLKRTGASVDPDLCQQLLLRLPKPVTREIIFSDAVFEVLQDMWLEARTSEREILSDAGMMDRAKQLDALAAESNETVEEVDRASRTLHQSAAKLADISEHFHKQLEVTAKLASLIPMKYTHHVGCNTEVSVVGEVEMLWDALMVQRDLELLDTEDESKLTMLLERQNKAKAEDIIRVRMHAEAQNSKLGARIAMLSQQLAASEAQVASLRSQVELLTVGPGGSLDFEDQAELMEAHKKEVDELMRQMNVKLGALRTDHQNRVRQLVMELSSQQSRADLLQKRLVETEESIKSSEEELVMRITELEGEVKSRDFAASHHQQLVIEYELKYKVQEERYKELEEQLQASVKHVRDLEERIAASKSEYANVVPASTVERRLEELRQQLAVDIETERLSKTQFSQQLQAAKTELQRAEFAALDKQAVLEERIRAVECERDHAENEALSSTRFFLSMAQRMAELMGSARRTVASCVSYEALHDTVCGALRSLVRDAAAVVEGLHSCAWIEPGSDESEAVDDILRRLQQEQVAQMPPPRSQVVEKLEATTKQLLATTSELEVVTSERRRLAELVQRQDSVWCRVLSQVVEMVNALFGDDAITIMMAEGHHDDATHSHHMEDYLMLNDLSPSCRDAAETCFAHLIQRHATWLQSARTTHASVVAQQISRCERRMEAERRERAANRANQPRLILEPLRDALAAIQRRAIGGAFADSERLPQVSRLQLAALASSKRAWSAARGRWGRHLWALCRCLWRQHWRRSRCGDDAAAETAIDSLTAQSRETWDAAALTFTSAALHAACCVLDAVAEAVTASRDGTPTPRSAFTSVDVTPRPTADIVETGADVASHGASRRSSSLAAVAAVVRTTSKSRSQSRGQGAATGTNRSRHHGQSDSVRGRDAQSEGNTTPLGVSIAESRPTVVRDYHDGSDAGAAVESINSETSPEAWGTPRDDGTVGTDGISATDMPEALKQRSLSLSAKSSGNHRSFGGVATAVVSMVRRRSSVAAHKHPDDSLSQRPPLNEVDDAKESSRPPSSDGGSSQFVAVVDTGAQTMPWVPTASVTSETMKGATAPVVHVGVQTMPSRTAPPPSGTPVGAAKGTAAGSVVKEWGEAREAGGDAVDPCPVIPSPVFRHHHRGPQLPSELETPRDKDVLGPSYRSGAATPSSDADATESAAVRRVDSASRRAVQQRPMSSGSNRDRPPSAIRLDEESETLLRGSGSAHDAAVWSQTGGDGLRSYNLSQGRGGAPAHGSKGTASSLTYASMLTLPEMVAQVKTLAQKGLHFTDIAFPSSTEAAGGVPLDLDAPLRYLFDSLPSHCRIAAAKYALLAMFGGKSIDDSLFVEYLLTEHFYPNRDVFIIPTDDELRMVFTSLRRLGATLTRCKAPAAPPPTVGPSPATTKQVGWESTSPGAHASPTLLPAAARPTSTVTFASAAGEFPTMTHTRPFSANSFPPSVVVLPTVPLGTVAHTNMMSVLQLEPSPHPLLSPVAVEPSTLGAARTNAAVTGPLIQNLHDNPPWQPSSQHTLPLDAAVVHGVGVPSSTNKNQTNQRRALLPMEPTVLPIAAKAASEALPSAASLERVLGGLGGAIPVDRFHLQREEREHDASFSTAVSTIADVRRGLTACDEELHDVAAMLHRAEQYLGTDEDATATTSTTLPGLIKPQSATATSVKVVELPLATSRPPTPVGATTAASATRLRPRPLVSLVRKGSAVASTSSTPTTGAGTSQPRQSQPVAAAAPVRLSSAPAPSSAMKPLFLKPVNAPHPTTQVALINGERQQQQQSPVVASQVHSRPLSTSSSNSGGLRDTVTASLPVPVSLPVAARRSRSAS